MPDSSKGKRLEAQAILLQVQRLLTDVQKLLVAADEQDGYGC